MNITEIVNAALIFLGDEPINNLDENSQNVRLIKSQINTCRKELFDLMSWDFAYRTIKLNEVSVHSDDLQYKHQYYLPPDCMYLKLVGTKEEVKRYNRDYEFVNLNERADFRIVPNNTGQNIIFCNVAEAYAVYYVELQNTGVYPIDFANALTYLIAVKVAFKITGERTDEDRATVKFNFYKNEALTKSLNRQKIYKKRRVSEIIQDRYTLTSVYHTRRHF